MTRMIRTITTAVALAGLSFTSLLSAEEVPQAVHDLVPQMEALGSDATLISAVNAHNSKGMTLDQIQKMDKEWRAEERTNDFMKGLMSNDAAMALSKFEQSQPYYFELFLMGNQGANVAMTNKTSDYWQGDEAKFQESFKGGAGAVHIGDVEFDDSAQAYLVQVSVPVKDGGKVVGAITIGINLDELEAAQ